MYRYIYEKQYVRRRGKAENIEEYTEGEGDHVLYSRVYGKMRREMTADKEHIKGLVPDDAAEVEHLVKYHSDTDKEGKVANGREHRAVFRSYVTAGKQEYSD